MFEHTNATNQNITIFLWIFYYYIYLQPYFFKLLVSNAHVWTFYIGAASAIATPFTYVHCTREANVAHTQVKTFIAKKRKRLDKFYFFVTYWIQSESHIHTCRVVVDLFVWISLALVLVLRWHFAKVKYEREWYSSSSIGSIGMVSWLLVINGRSCNTSSDTHKAYRQTGPCRPKGYIWTKLSDCI